MASTSLFCVMIAVASLFVLQANAQSTTTTVNVTSTVSVTPSASSSVVATPAATTAAATSIVGNTASSVVTTASANTAGSTGSSSAGVQPTSTQPTPAATTSAAVAPTSTPEPTTKAPTPAKATVESSIKIESKYTPDLGNPNSAAFKDLANNVSETMEAELPSGSQVNVTSFSQGSIIVNFTITFNVVEGFDLVANLTKIIKTGNLGTFTVDKSYMVFKQSYKDVTLGEYKLDSASYLANCCQSTIGNYKLTRTCTAKAGASCYGIPVEKEEDCGKAVNPPTCSKACCLSNMSIVIMLLCFIGSKIFA